MGISVQIGGIPEILKLSAQIKATGDKGLGRQMGRAISKAMDPVKGSITASAAQTMPSGYGPTLTRSLKHRTAVRNTARTASVRLTTSAKGESESRDLPALEAGNLRHPVFGRSRPTRRGRKANPWALTRIRSGFHERGTRRAADLAEKALAGVRDDFADRLMKG